MGGITPFPRSPNGGDSKAQTGPATIDTIRDLMRDIGISVRFNELSGQLDIDGMPARYSRTNAVNTLPPFLLDVARTQGIRASRQLIDDALITIGDECRFHPVRDMLTGEPWDGQPRVGVVLDALHLPPDSFAATVNPDNFINDDSGSRRFWTVHLNALDLDMLFRLDRDWFFQLWREVYTTDFLPNPQGFRLSLEERAELSNRNQTFDKPLPYESEIMESLDWDTPPEMWCWWSVKEMKQLVGGFNPSSEQIGRAMRKICDRDERSSCKVLHGCRTYFLPPRKGTSECL